MNICVTHTLRESDIERGAAAVDSHETTRTEQHAGIFGRNAAVVAAV